MSIRSLSARLSRIEAQRDNRTYQAAWDVACRQLGWTPIDVGNARCIEDLLLALQLEKGSVAVQHRPDHSLMANQIDRPLTAP